MPSSGPAHGDARRDRSIVPTSDDAEHSADKRARFRSRYPEHPPSPTAAATRSRSVHRSRVPRHDARGSPVRKVPRGPAEGSARCCRRPNFARTGAHRGERLAAAPPVLYSSQTCISRRSEHGPRYPNTSSRPSVAVRAHARMVEDERLSPGRRDVRATRPFQPGRRLTCPSAGVVHRLHFGCLPIRGYCGRSRVDRFLLDPKCEARIAQSARARPIPTARRTSRHAEPDVRANGRDGPRASRPDPGRRARGPIRTTTHRCAATGGAGSDPRLNPVIDLLRLALTILRVSG